LIRKKYGFKCRTGFHLVGSLAEVEVGAWLRNNEYQNTVQIYSIKISLSASHRKFF